MSQHTKIQWADSTANPIYGCDGCVLWRPEAGEKRCYAGIMTERFGRSNTGLTSNFDHVRYKPGQMAQAASWPDLAGIPRLDKPWIGTLPRHIFVSDMGDALSNAVTFEYLESEIINVVSTPAGARHRWLWLTKRPERMARFYSWISQIGVPWPSNLYAGESIIQKQNVALIRSLERVGDETTTRFLSVEPQRDPIDLKLGDHPGIGWVIQGGESGHNANTFQLDWAYQMIEQCRAYDVPYFLKQLGQNVTTTDLSVGGIPYRCHNLHGHDWDEWPEDLRVREFPKFQTQNGANNGRN